MKGSMLMGTQRNKLGNLVYYRRRGEEIARAKVTPANPRSERQARQRMNFATLQHAKSRLAEIVNHSFQGVAYGDISLNHFTKLNVPILTNAAANPSENAAYFIPKGVKGLAPNEYIVSDGSLAQLPLKTNANGVELVGSDYTAALAGPDDYVEQLASMGFQPGDQLTAMCIVNTGSVIATTPAGDSIFDMQMIVKRIVFKTLAEISDWSGITSLWVAGSEDRMSVNPALLVADKSDEITFGTTEPGQTADTVAVIFVDEVGAYGSGANLAASVVIRSSLVNGQWLRSPQKLLLNDDGESRPSVADVLSTYMDVQTDPDSPYYLNQSQARSAQASGIDEVVVTGYDSVDMTISGSTFYQHGGDYPVAIIETNGNFAASAVVLTPAGGDDLSSNIGTITVNEGKISIPFIQPYQGSLTGSLNVSVNNKQLAVITAFILA